MKETRKICIPEPKVLANSTKIQINCILTESTKESLKTGIFEIRLSYYELIYCTLTTVMVKLINQNWIRSMKSFLT